MHTGNCRAASRSGRYFPPSRVQAFDASRRQVPRCTYCRPRNALGFPGAAATRCRWRVSNAAEPRTAFL
ncbi:DUF6233 domain-containing protein [Streptomyces sp. NPDC001315]|uniref:DUF6233 domain-containing protein n=1 Tax=Streptomyces sp. NPDC001315 TaxID=3364562 RepID=UPI003680332E